MKKVWIADDGAIFDNFSACKEYEINSKLDNQKIKFQYSLSITLHNINEEIITSTRECYDSDDLKNKIENKLINKYSYEYNSDKMRYESQDLKEILIDIISNKDFTVSVATHLNEIDSFKVESLSNHDDIKFDIEFEDDDY